MLLNILLVLAALALAAYPAAPLVTRHLATIVKGFRRWRRYNQLCRIRRTRTSRWELEQQRRWKEEGVRIRPEYSPLLLAGNDYAQAQAQIQAQQRQMPPGSLIQVNDITSFSSTQAGPIYATFNPHPMPQTQEHKDDDCLNN